MRPALIVLALCAVSLAACGSDTPRTTAAPSPTANAGTAASRSAGEDECPSRTARSSAEVAGAPLQTLLRVPHATRSRPAPLVIALHFATGSGAEMERATGLTDEAGRAGFDVAYPTATSNGFWHPSDLPKLQQTLAAIEQAACIDRSRVYMLGMSNGGGMAALAACRMADTVAAVVLFAPAVGSSEPCSPSRPISVLEVHGTADELVPYADGRTLIDAWARRDECDGTPATTPTGERATTLRWRGCRDDAAVEHVRLDHGRHIELFPDLRAAGIDPATAAWRFLSPHRLT
jgi:polyhydroxybutyrate depolymerase